MLPFLLYLALEPMKISSTLWVEYFWYVFMIETVGMKLLSHENYFDVLSGYFYLLFMIKTW